MRQMKMLLIYAALLIAYGHANPYSRIPDQSADIYNQYSDRSFGANDQTGVASAHASANSDSHNGGYASASSSSSSFATNNVNVNSGYGSSVGFKTPLGNAGSEQTAQSVQSAQSGHAGQNYWWMNSNSPFNTDGQSSSGCTSNQCSGGNSANFNVNKGSANEGGHVGSGNNNGNFQGNPFLQGNVNAGSAHSKNQHDISKNPFFTGSASSGASSSASVSANANSPTNQFPQNYNKNFDQVGQNSEQEQTHGYFGQSTNQGNVGGGLSVSCSGVGKICVAKHLCHNGHVSNSVQGLTQIKSDDQQCDIDTEVCCTLSNGAFSPANDQTAAGSHVTTSQSDNQVYINTAASSPINGGIFGTSNNRRNGIDLNSGDQQSVDTGDSSNGYLPPIGGEPSSNVPAFADPPRREDEPDNIPSPSGPAPTHVQLGCAAALICVEEQYCGMDGMINQKSVILSSAQLIMRVPLSDCKNPDNGVIGKCCRDPNYVDPWPTGNLPANYSGGFDEQGFPTFLNIQRTRPAKKPAGSPVKGAYSPVKNIPKYAVTPAPPQRFGYSSTYSPQTFATSSTAKRFEFSSTYSPQTFATSPTPKRFEFSPSFPSQFSTTVRPVQSVEYSPTYQTQTSPTPPPVQRFEYSPTYQTQTSPTPPPVQRFEYSPTYQAKTSSTPSPVQRFEYSPTYQAKTSSTPSPVQRFEYSPTYQTQTSATPAPAQRFEYSSTPTPAYAVTPPAPQKFVFSPPTGIPSGVASLPDNFGQGFTNIFSGKPFQTGVVGPRPGAKEDFPTANFPATSKRPFPILPSPFSKNKFDESSSNTNPIVIAPHVAGAQCGFKNTVQRPSDLDDVEVGFGEIPWEAMILSNREKKLLCSGALIAPNAVITAARCVYGFKPNDVSIKVGEWKLGYELKHEEPLPFEIVQVSNIVVHPGYQQNYPSHDIAILILNHSVKFDQHVGTICIREQIEQSYALVGKKCISTGWGKHVLQSHLAGAIMHSIDVDVIDQDTCQQRLSGAESQIEVDDSLVCTNAHKQRNNMCQVDLGGPLACDRGDGIYEIIGVYNQDTGCSPTNQVATFAIIDDTWVKHVLSQPPVVAVDLYAPAETSSRNVPHAHSRKDERCECQNSNLSPDEHQYLPPV